MIRLILLFLTTQICLTSLYTQPDLFGPQLEITQSTDGAYSVYASDLDGDGDMDVLSASYDDDKIAWYENDGEGGFGEQLVITTSANRASCVYASDLDGDGDMDVLSASSNDNKIAWYENLQTANADFVVEKCITNNEEYTFYNNSNFTTFNTTTIQWIYNDEVTSSELDFVFDQFIPGIHDLTLITCTTTSCDTITKPIKVMGFELDAVPLLTAGVPYTFTNTSEFIEYWSWDFGDNTHSDLPTPTHTYTEAGVYVLEVSIYNLSWGNDCFLQLEYEVIVEGDPTGIADTKHPLLHFYPNPAQDIIHFPSLSTDQAYTLYNAQGAALLSTNTKDRKIDLSALTSGLYFIHFPEMGMIKLMRE